MYSSNILLLYQGNDYNFFFNSSASFLSIFLSTIDCVKVFKFSKKKHYFYNDNIIKTYNKNMYQVGFRRLIGIKHLKESKYRLENKLLILEKFVMVVI